MSEARIRQVVVLGGGLAGWAAAAALSHTLREQRMRIRVLEQPHSAPDSLAEATLPYTTAFHRKLDINERDLMAFTQATFRLGTEFLGWWPGQEPAFMPLGRHGAGIDYLPFQHYAIRKHLDGDTTPMDAYSIGAQAARRGVFTHPSDDSSSPLFTMAYGLHVDSSLYAQYMRLVAQQNGVQAITGHWTDIRQDADNGFVEAVVLDNGEALEADLFIDAGGPGKPLLERGFDVRFLGWSGLMPCQRVLSRHVPAKRVEPPRTDNLALACGWKRRLPLQDRVVEELSFPDTLIDERQALQVLDAVKGQDISARSLRIGRLERFWVANVVTLGPAAGSLDGLAAGPLDLAQRGIVRLLELFPDRQCDPALAGEYNLQTGWEYDNLRDFHLAHRLGVPAFGTSLRGVTASPALRARMDVFDCHGQLPQFRGETFDENGWASLFLVQGRWPAAYNRCLDSLDLARLDERFRKTRELISKAVAQMPSQRDYLARYCPAMPR